MFEEKTLESKEIYKGKVINVRVDKVLTHNGGKSFREIISHNGGSAIVAKKDNKIIFVRQFRKAIESSILEIPAGKLDPGEDPAECAKRELHEETGYIAKNIEVLGKIFPTPGYSNEVIYLYYTDDLELSKAQPDEDEFVSVEEIEIPTVLEMVYSGKITDGKTLSGLFLALNRIKD